MKHSLRDLADQIYALAKEHPAYSQAFGAVQNCVDHLTAKAAYFEQMQINQTTEKVDVAKR